MKQFIYLFVSIMCTVLLASCGEGDGEKHYKDIPEGFSFEGQSHFGDSVAINVKGAKSDGDLVLYNERDFLTQNLQGNIKMENNSWNLDGSLSVNFDYTFKGERSKNISFLIGVKCSGISNFDNSQKILTLQPKACELGKIELQTIESEPSHEAVDTLAGVRVPIGFNAVVLKELSSKENLDAIRNCLMRTRTYKFAEAVVFDDLNKKGEKQKRCSLMFRDAEGKPDAKPITCISRLMN